LTVKEFRFATRVWYLKNTPSICAGCSRGCNLIVAVGRKQELMTSPGQSDDGIKRIVPRVNEDVNGHWICDEGRLSYLNLEAAERLPYAQDRDGAELEWEDALERAGRSVRAAAEAGRLGVVVSPRATNETLYALKKLIAGVGGARVGTHRIHRGENDHLLIRADKGANSTGAAAIVGGEDAVLVTLAVRNDELDTLVVMGDLLDPADTIDLQGADANVKQIVYIGPFADEAAAVAHVKLPAAAWAEEDGTMVNCDGRIQLVRRCHRPRGEGRPGWLVLQDLMQAVGLESPGWSEWREVYDTMCVDVAVFAGTSARAIGLLGMSTGEPASAGA
jgi:NADH-quinone oxidoreductase subunit G